MCSFVSAATVLCSSAWSSRIFAISAAAAWVTAATFPSHAALWSWFCGCAPHNGHSHWFAQDKELAGFLDGDEAFDVVRVLRVEQLEPFLEFRDLVAARGQCAVRS